MKKLLFAASFVALVMSSCTTVEKTASAIDVNNNINSVTAVDLDVSNTRISYVYRTTKKVRKGGSKNVYATAVSAALKANDNANVLVAPEYETVIKKGLFGSKIKTVTVSGYPAKYKNFRIEK